MKLAARERVRRDTKTAFDDDNRSAMIHVVAHRAYVYTKAKPNTHVDVLEEDQSEEGQVCGCCVKAMYGTRQAASAWQEEVEKAMFEATRDSRSIVAVCVWIESRSR